MPDGSGQALAQTLPDGVPAAEPETLNLRGAIDESQPASPGAEAVREPIRAAPANGGMREDVRQPVRAPLRLDAPPEAATEPVAVTEEAEPFAPQGVSLGAFRAFTQFRQDLGYDSNPGRVRGSPRGDLFSRSQGGIRIESDWVRHELRASLRGSYDAFRRDSVNNRPALDADAALRLDLREDTRLITTGRLDLATERPGALEVPGSIVDRPGIVTSLGEITLEHDLNRLRLALRGGLSHTAHADGRDAGGARVDQSARDVTRYEAAMRLGYEVSPGLIPFAEIGLDRRLAGATATRTRDERRSTGLTGRAGARFELTRLITGEASLGYQQRRYVDPTRRSLGGIVADAGLTWTPGPLTTVTFNAAKSLDETTVIGSSGVRALRFDLGVRHELRRRLVLRADLGHFLTRYGGAGPTERGFTGGLGLDYRFNRYASAALDYRHERLRSTVPEAGYDASIYLLGLRLDY